MSVVPPSGATAERPLAGAVGIVTGGGKGLGRAFALDLARAGAAVVVNNRNRVVDDDGNGPADHVVAEIARAGGTAVAEHSDVADPEAAQAILDAAITEYGRVDFLVTSAGVSDPAMFHKTTREAFDRVVAINLAGTAHLAMRCAAHMRAAGGGRIVLVASTAGLYGEPTASAYSASKGAVIALGRAIAGEGAARDVLTNVVLPYATTQMTDTGMATRHRDRMDPALVAPVVTALADRGCTVNGQVLVAGGGGLCATAAVDYETVLLPAGSVSPAHLTELVAASRAGGPREYGDAYEEFLDFAADVEARSGSVV